MYERNVGRKKVLLINLQLHKETVRNTDWLDTIDTKKEEIRRKKDDDDDDDDEVKMSLTSQSSRINDSI